MHYESEQARYDAIRADARAKLTPRRPDLAVLEGEALVRKLTEEALAGFYTDQAAANYAWDYVENQIRLAVGEA